jgi:hypothetical protein
VALANLVQAAQLCRLDSLVCQCQLADLIDDLRYGGVQPLVSQGWASARLYPEPGLRSHRDSLLHVDPSRLEEAQRVLAAPAHAEAAGWVHLRPGARQLSERTLGDLYQHAQRDQLREVVVRLLGPEDHLRLLCLHFADQGGAWPLWLCDVGVMVESLPAGFDWDYFRSGEPKRSWWAWTVIGLAARLLGAQIDLIPDHEEVSRQCVWLDPIILSRWGKIAPGEGDSTGLLSPLDTPCWPL